MTLKSENYYSNIRLDLLELITKKQNYKVLEIGAGFGDTLSYLKETCGATEAVGVDVNYSVSRKEAYDRVDHFIFGNVEQVNLDQYENYFDVIILADVLEHLKNPEELLSRIKKNLKKDGEIVSSIPNIRTLNAFYKIFIKGTFPLEHEGLFDSTHLRFYCKRDMIAMFHSADFKVSNIESALKNYKHKSLKKNINKLTFGIFEEFLSTQYFIRAINA